MSFRVARAVCVSMVGMGGIGAGSAADMPGVGAADTATPGVPAAAPDVPSKPLPIALIDALNKLSGGPHKGYRANHAKGLMVEGTLTLTAPVADQATAQKTIMFSPLHLAAGIEPSADPVLSARPAAYGVSYSQRLQP